MLHVHPNRGEEDVYIYITNVYVLKLKKKFNNHMGKPWMEVIERNVLTRVQYLK